MNKSGTISTILSLSHRVKRDTSSTLGKGNLVFFISFPTHLYSSLMMDRQSTPPSVYNNNDKFDAMKNNLDANMDAQMEEIKALIKSYKRSSSSSRRRSRAHVSELPSPAKSHRHRHHHQQEHEGQELNTNNRSMTSPSPLASLPSYFKASSPMGRHLRHQAH